MWLENPAGRSSRLARGPRWGACPRIACRRGEPLLRCGGTSPQAGAAGGSGSQHADLDGLLGRAAAAVVSGDGQAERCRSPFRQGSSFPSPMPAETTLSLAAVTA